MFCAHDPGLAVFIAERDPAGEPPMIVTAAISALAAGLLILLLSGALT